jgi:hypothetical protein
MKVIVLSFIVFCWFGLTPASSFCVDSSTASLGYKLVSAAGVGTVSNVTVPMLGETMIKIESNLQDKQNSNKHYHATSLLRHLQFFTSIYQITSDVIETVNGNDIMRSGVKTEREISGLFPFPSTEIGATSSYAMIVTQGNYIRGFVAESWDGMPRKARLKIELKIVGHDTISLSNCSYDVIIVDGNTINIDTDEKHTSTSYFAPVLGGIALKVITDGKETYSAIQVLQ